MRAPPVCARFCIGFQIRRRHRSHIRLAGPLGAVSEVGPGHVASCILAGQPAAKKPRTGDPPPPTAEDPAADPNPQWWQDPGTCFVNCPQEHHTREDDPAALSSEMRLFYVLQLAIWMWTGFSCKWLEERRKDYVEMMLHHVLL